MQNMEKTLGKTRQNWNYYKNYRISDSYMYDLIEKQTKILTLLFLAKVI